MIAGYPEVDSLIRSDEGLMLRNVSFRISLWWPIHIFNSLRKQPSFFAPGPSGVAIRAGSEEGRTAVFAGYISNPVDKTKLSCNTPTDAAPQFL